MKSFNYLFIILLFLSTHLLAAVGDSYDNAEAVNVNTQTSGQLLYQWGSWRNGGSYYDYKFTPIVDGTVHIYTTGFSYDSDLDMYNATDYSTRIASDRTYSNNVDITYDVTANETYILDLYNFKSNKKDTYILYIDFTSNNNPPILTPDTFTINRNSSTGASVGIVAASPSATSFTILSGDDESIFTIDSSGNITVASATNLANASLLSYTLSVQGINSFGISTPVDIVINIIVDYDTVNTRPFTKVLINDSNAINIRGDLLMIGNQSICQGGGTSCTQPSNTDSNNAVTQRHVNLDSTATSLESSTMATLNLEPGDTVIWAGLYWQARLSSEDSKRASASSLQLKTPDTNSGYVTVTSNVSKFNWFDDGNTWDYAAMQDVTRFIQTGGDIWVANVQSTEGKNMAAGWSLSVIVQNDTRTLKNISVYDGFQGVYDGDTTYPNSVSSDITDFLTPFNGTVNSSLFFYANESDRSLGDSTTVTNINGTAISLSNTVNPSNNVVNATISKLGVNVTSRNPNYENVLGIDIDEFDVSDIIGNGQTSTTITIASNGDRYFLSEYAFTTELYEPRVCYYIDTIVDSSGNNIFEGGKFTSDIQSDTEYTFNFWISNMKKDAADTDLEIAKLVQIYLNMSDFTYTASSSNIYNIGTSGYQSMSDSYNIDNNYSNPANDLGEYISNTSTWRVGDGASNLEGGILDVASGFSDTANIVKVNIKGKLTGASSGDINLLDYLNFKASFKTDSITIGSDNAQNIAQCQDLNSTGSFIGISGAFNIVNRSFTGNTDPLSDAVDQSLNSIPTQVSNKPILLRLLALDPADNTTLMNYTGDVNVSIIITPPYVEGATAGNQQKCEAAAPILTQTFTMNNQDRIDITFTNTPSAYKNISFKMGFESGGTTEYTCSRDVFAIRPDKFVLTSPVTNIELLHSGVDYSFSLKAQQFDNTSNTNGYNVTDAQNIFANLDANKSIYAPDGTIPNPPLNGTLSFAAANFDIINGLANNVVGISFDDVGKVKIRLVDVNWSKVDIDNGDTPADCSVNGAYICGDVDATFIPDHFALSAANVFNSNGSAFTYLSGDLNMSAGITVTINAENDSNGTTSNFTANAWEKPVDVSLNIPTVNGLTSNPNDIDETLLLNFNNGTRTINYNDTNTSANLIFNYSRRTDTVINPFEIDGADVNLTANYTYTASDGVTTDPISSPTINPNQNATFIYGRTNAPRQRFEGPTGSVFIYYEAYCNDIDTSGITCDKTLLPGLGVDAKYSDDPRWFVNTAHATVSGIARHVNQKNSNNVTGIDITAATGGKSNTVVTYENADTKGYPYKATMENNASSWLIYNRFDATNSDTTNEFEVEFDKGGSSWAGKQTNDTTTNSKASTKTNRRSMW